MIEINGKIYRNIQEQVAKNQEDIEDLKGKYRHRILAFNTQDSYNEFVVFDIVNDISEAYTTLDDVLEAIGNNNIIAIQGCLSIGAEIYKVAKHDTDLRVYYIETSSYTSSYTDLTVTNIVDQVL